MLSRVADSVYWLSRYVERAENVARFIDVNENLTLGDGKSLADQWSPLVYITGDEERFEANYGQFNRESILRFLLFDEQNPNSIVSCVLAARENARMIRDIIPSDVWQELNRFYLMVRSAERVAETLDEPQEFCRSVRLTSHLLVGATDATMSHTEAWHFSRVGRFLERADKTSRIVDVQYYLLLPTPEQVGTALDVVRWSALLKSASALTMYRRQNGKIVPETVAKFLILDRDFPRAIHHCIVQAQTSLRWITGSSSGTYRNHSEQLVGQLCSSLDYASVRDIIEQGMHEYIDRFQTKLNQLGVAIRNDFFLPYPERQAQLQAAQSQSQSQHQTQKQSQSS